MKSLSIYKPRFVYKALVFVLLLVLVDYGAGLLLRHLYFKQQSGLLYRTTYAMDVTRSQALIFGSSRSNHHYQPEVMSAGLGMTTYNTGRDGNFILYNAAVLKSVLNRYTPEVVVLDLDIFTFHHTQENYDRLSALLPYYKTHPEIRDIVALKSPFEAMKLRSSVYPYNSMLFKILAGNFEMNKSRMLDVQGYVPLTEVYAKPMEAYTIVEKTDTVLVNAFETFITDAKAAGSKVFVVVSPVYYQYRHSATLVKAQELCHKHNVPYWDYSMDSSFQQNRELFADRAHLNDVGARRFSAIIAQRIKKTSL